MKKEEIIKKQLATYIKTQYPKVIFRFDIAADIRLSIGNARKSKAIHQHERGYPDLQILEPRGGYCGLFLELKTDRDKVFKKNGEYRNNEHVREQADFLNKLVKKGYYAEFCFGFEDCKNKIDYYLKISK